MANGLLGRTLLGISLFCGEASAADSAGNDAWLGRDKALHFSGALGISASGYAASTLFLRPRVGSIAFGAGLALALGAAKEGADALGLGTPSWKDFAWDAFGAVTGTLIAWGVDVLVGGVNTTHPLFLSASSR